MHTIREEENKLLSETDHSSKKSRFANLSNHLHRMAKETINATATAYTTALTGSEQHPGTEQAIVSGQIRLVRRTHKRRADGRRQRRLVHAAPRRRAPLRWRQRLRGGGAGTARGERAQQRRQLLRTRRTHKRHETM